MEIKYALGHDLGNEQGKRASRITIDLDAADDPDGYIVGLLMRGRLEDFLRVFALSRVFPEAEDKGAAYSLLTNFAYVTNRCGMRLDTLRLAARDQWKMGWGTIAAATSESRSTAKSRVLTSRDAFAADGFWFEPDGPHWDTAEKAQRHASLATTSDRETKD